MRPPEVRWEGGNPIDAICAILGVNLLLRRGAQERQNPLREALAGRTGNFGGAVRVTVSRCSAGEPRCWRIGR